MQADEGGKSGRQAGILADMAESYQFFRCARPGGGARQPIAVSLMMGFCEQEPPMRTFHLARLKAPLLAALLVTTLASLAGCREKHEPLKPTVSATAQQAGAGP